MNLDLCRVLDGLESGRSDPKNTRNLKFNYHMKRNSSTMDKKKTGTIIGSEVLNVLNLVVKRMNETGIKSKMKSKAISHKKT